MSLQYLSIDEARQATGLRLVLTRGVPGPWSEAAKAVFRHHGVTFAPVEQLGAQANPELVEWTGHRNAPVAMYNDEPPRVRWQEILDLAERLGWGNSLYPSDRSQRIDAVGLSSEIAGEQGFAWNCRLIMFDSMVKSAGEEAARKNPMLNEYRYDADTIPNAVSEVRGFLDDLASRIKQGNGYLVGDQFSAPDLYWAYFSNLLFPQPEDINPMPDYLRKTYHIPARAIGDFDPVVIEHRDRIFQRHLELPLTF